MGNQRKKSGSSKAASKHRKTTPWWKNPQVNKWCALAVVLTFIAFLPSLQNGFTNWDDNLYVTENPMIYGLGVKNIKAIFSQPIAANYHPITMLSLAINYQFSGHEAFGYHLVNLLLHLANIVLVFYFIWLLSKGKKWVAFVAAVLFGIHPMHVESVAWIAERKDVLYSFFFFLGLISYLQYRVKRTRRLYIFTFTWFLLSVLSKPAAVVFPVVLILLDYWRFSQSSSTKKRWNWQKILLPKIPFFLVSFIMGIITIYTQSPKAIGAIDTFTFFQRFVFVCYGFVMYLVKALIPFNLSAIYPYPSLKTALPMTFKIMPILAAMILAMIWYSWRYTKVVVLGMAFFIINIILVLQIISVGSAIMADRYSYIPYIGIFIILGYGFDYLLKRPKTKNMAVLFAAFYLLVLSAFTFQRTKIWKNDEVIWTDAIEKYPDAVVALNNRGAYFNDLEQLDKALSDFNRVLKLNSKYFDSLLGRGSIYRKVGQFEKALADAQAAAAIDSKDERPYIIMGGVYFQQQQYEKSLEVLEKALAINPNNSDGVLNKGILLSIDENFEASLSLFSQHIQLRPNDERAYLYRGISHQNLNENQAALQDYNRALQLNPQHGQAYFKRSEIHLQLGNKKQALQDAQKAQSFGFNVSQDYLRSLR